VDAQQTRSAQDAPGNNQAATTHMPSSLTFVMERAGLPNASVLASNKLANPEFGNRQAAAMPYCLVATARIAGSALVAHAIPRALPVIC